MLFAITFSRFAVRLANFYLFTVSGENTVNCLEGFFIVFQQFLSALGKSIIKSLMNFEPSCVKGCYKSLFSTNPIQYSGKAGECWDQSRINFMRSKHHGGIKRIFIRCC